MESRWTQLSKTLIGCLLIDGPFSGLHWITVTSLFSYHTEVSTIAGSRAGNVNYETSFFATHQFFLHLLRFFCKDPQRHIIKRIVGLEGDIIRNDKYSSREVVIPRGYCWVEGDNTGASIDSIKYGPSKNETVFNFKFGQFYFHFWCMFLGCNQLRAVILL